MTVAGEAAVVTTTAEVFEAAAIQVRTAAAAAMPLMLVTMALMLEVKNVVMTESVEEQGVPVTEASVEAAEAAAAAAAATAAAVAQVLGPSRSAKTMKSPCRTRAG